ncbi:hypothetical protein, partial [Paenibacillus phytorum]|uniref:hypothetical protein n=1 Tax=Paenibacillus phytorum TaxID=2654977 RepID=UPI001C111F41
NGTITNGRGRLEIHTWYEKFVNLNKVHLNCPFDTVNKRRKRIGTDSCHLSEQILVIRHQPTIVVVVE